MSSDIFIGNFMRNLNHLKYNKIGRLWKNLNYIQAKYIVFYDLDFYNITDKYNYKS